MFTGDILGLLLYVRGKGMLFKQVVFLNAV